MMEIGANGLRLANQWSIWIISTRTVVRTMILIPLLLHPKGVHEVFFSLPSYPRGFVLSGIRQDFVFLGVLL